MTSQSSGSSNWIGPFGLEFDPSILYASTGSYLLENFPHPGLEIRVHSYLMSRVT